MRRRKWLVAGLVLAVAVLAAGLALRPADPVAGVRTVAVGLWPLAVAVDPQTGYAFVVDHANQTSDARGYFGGQGTVSVVDVRSGAVVRSVAVGPDPRAIAVDERAGRALVANDDDASVSVVDTRSGAFLRSIPVGARPHGVVVDPQTGRAFVANTAAGTVSMVDVRRGTVVRNIPISASFFVGGMAIDARRGRVFIESPGAVAVLDARSGALRRTIPLDQSASNMAIDPRSGRLFVAGAKGVSVFDPRSGRALRTIPIGGNAAAVAVDSRRGLVLVASSGGIDDNGMPAGTGSVIILDARSGAVLRSVPVGVAPIALAVDERSGRAIVVNSGGTVRIPNIWAQIPDWLRHVLPFLPQPDETRTEPGSVSILNTSG